MKRFSPKASGGSSLEEEISLKTRLGGRRERERSEEKTKARGSCHNTCG